MNKIKKSMLFIGTAATVVAPITTVVACGGGQKTEHFNLLPTYTGQADQLIALGIHADYYPLQLNEKKPYEYLTNPAQYMKLQSKDFKAKFAARVKDLLPKRQDTGWWNQDALASDEAGSDPSYWQSKDAGVLLYEHYLLDDNRKIIDNSKAPKHKVEAAVQTNFRSSRDPYTRINKGVFFGWDLTDENIEHVIKGETLVGQANPVVIKVANGRGGGVDSSVTVKPGDAKIIKAMRLKRKELVAAAAGGATSATSDWFYNDWYFVDSYHRMFLDNQDFQGTGSSSKSASNPNAGAFAAWLIDSTEKSPFTTPADKIGVNKEKTVTETLPGGIKVSTVYPATTGTTQAVVDADIKALFDASTFQQDEIKHSVGPKSNSNPHHPIYEQQDGEIGAAPMFEGAVRDNQLYLFNVAWQLDNLVTYGTPYGKQHYDEMVAAENKPGFVKPAKSLDGIAVSSGDADKIKNYVQGALTHKQVEESKLAFENSLAITAQLKARMVAMKSYFQELGQAGKTFGLLTIAPGHGVSTIQSMSKYSFIYDGLGFKQPLPRNLHSLADGATMFTDAWEHTGTGADAVYNGKNKYLDRDGKVSSSAPGNVQAAVGPANGGAATLFNMDDNGWYWTVGETGHLQTNQLRQFGKQFDFGFIAGRDENFEADVTNSDINEAAVKALWKDSKDSDNINDVRVNYDLWNEGLKTPFVLHMLLDEIMEQVEKKLSISTTEAGNTTFSGTENSTQTKRDAAKSWGNYFTNKYINTH